MQQARHNAFFIGKAGRLAEIIMALITFFEKPGCGGNAKQKKLLHAAGHTLIVRDLLQEPWTPGRLRQFFDGMPLTAWFNPAAPRIKSGEVDPSRMDEGEALALMLADPLLIRRPLMISGELYMAGFDNERVERRFGVTVAGDVQSCTRHDSSSCPPPKAVVE